MIFVPDAVGGDAHPWEQENMNMGTHLLNKLEAMGAHRGTCISLALLHA